MKKLAVLLVLFFIIVNGSRSTVIPVTVANFSFSPANFTAQIGDVIQFSWSSGSHTTTSTTIPAGATSWDEPINIGSPTFSYTIDRSGTYNFICTPHAGGGMIGSFTVSAVAPVKLVNFSALSDKSGVKLTWHTLTEENANYFQIQRSYDGMAFDSIGKIQAAGNSTTIQIYSFTDEQFNSNSRYLYYRLLTIDLDLKSQYSSIIQYRLDQQKASRFVTSLFPNPTRTGAHIHLYFNSDIKDKLLIQIYDLSGRLLSNSELLAVQGVNHTHFPLPRLIRGNYLINFQLKGLKGLKESYLLHIL